MNISLQNRIRNIRKLLITLKNVKKNKLAGLLQMNHLNQRFDSFEMNHWNWFTEMNQIHNVAFAT